MTICSLDIPLQVLIRPAFNSNIRSCKPVLQWLLIIPATSLLTATYSVKYCHLLVLQKRALTDRGEPRWLSNESFNQMSKVTRGQVSVELSRSGKYDPKAVYMSHARGSECTYFIYVLLSSTISGSRMILKKMLRVEFYVILNKEPLHRKYNNIIRTNIFFVSKYK